jgi:hypothetical protein
MPIFNNINDFHSKLLTLSTLNLTPSICYTTLLMTSTISCNSKLCRTLQNPEILCNYHIHNIHLLPTQNSSLETTIFFQFCHHIPKHYYLLRWLPYHKEHLCNGTYQFYKTITNILIFKHLEIQSKSKQLFH